MEGVELILFLVGALIIYRFRKRSGMIGRIKRRATKLCNVVAHRFLMQACPRCLETEMRLLDVSTNARSVHYECAHCSKRMRAAATSPEAAQAVSLYADLQVAMDEFRRVFRKGDVNVDMLFTLPEAPLPFEKTTREPITEGVRSEVWRRDGGRCVQCASNQQLEFDHIIPVSRGGATTARNLQLLCRSCNRAKATKI